MTARNKYSENTTVSDGDVRLIRNVYWEKTAQGSRKVEKPSSNCPSCGQDKARWAHLPNCRERD
jgi:DNA-directed RNA polymerase subunit M/transcription elongation factor TFIIS